MAKKKDQTPELEEETLAPEQTAEQEDLDAQEVKSDDAAVKASEEFDKLLDESDDIEATLLEDETEQKETEETEETTVEETPAEETEDTPVKEDGSGISDDIRQRATDLGMTPGEIAEFKDDADIEKTIKVLEGIDEKNEEPETPASEPAKPRAKEKGDELKPADSDELVIENEDEIDPIIVKIMKDQHKRNLELEARQAELDAKLTAGEQRAKAEREKVAMERFDEKITGLGKDYRDLFGEGATLKMSTRSTARKNRNKLGRHMVALGNAMAATGDEEITADALFKMSLNNVFYKEVEAIKGGELLEKTTRRSRQRTGRAATRKIGEKLTREQDTIQYNKDFDAEYLEDR